MGLFDGILGHGSSVDPTDLAKRLDGVLIDVQGITGSKVDYMSVPYRAITRFSVETAGTFDLDSELKIWVSGAHDPVTKTLKKGTDVRGIQRALAAGVLR